MTSVDQERLIAEAVAEAERDPKFAQALRRALDASIPKRRRRRAAPAVDPFGSYERGGEAGLREALASLDVEQLKDVIAHHQMDRARLAMKWQATERLIEVIVAQTMSRARKGEAFLRSERS